MILLSDAKPPNKKAKQIKLKPIIFPKTETTTDENAEETRSAELSRFTEQIADAKRRLEQTDEEIITKRRAIEQEIAKNRADWHIEKEQLIDETKKIAYHDGHQVGKRQGLDSVVEKIKQADQIVESAREQQLKIIEQSEMTILELATKIAGKIVAYEIEEHDGFLELVKQAIQEVHEQPTIKLYTSLDDFELVADQQEQLMTLLDPEVLLSIHPLDTLKQGDCIIKTPYSKLDVSVDQQLAKIKTRLFEVMEDIKRES